MIAEPDRLALVQTQGEADAFDAPLASIVSQVLALREPVRILIERSRLIVTIDVRERIEALAATAGVLELGAYERAVVEACDALPLPRKKVARLANKTFNPYFHGIVRNLVASGVLREDHRGVYRP